MDLTESLSHIALHIPHTGTWADVLQPGGSITKQQSCATPEASLEPL